MSNKKNVEVNANLKVNGQKDVNNAVKTTTKNVTSLQSAIIKLAKSQKTAAEFSNNSSRNFAASATEYSRAIQLYAATAATLFTVTSAFRALQTAAANQEMANSMKTLTAITGYSVASMVKDLKELSNNAVSTADAMRAANLSAAAGLDPDTFHELAMAAKGASKALGRDYADALDRITKGVIKGEPELLDELGIIVRLTEVYADYGKALGVATDDLSEYQKTQARTNAVIAQAQEKYGDLANLPANDIDQIAATAQDLLQDITALGVAAAAAIAPIATSASGMVGIFALLGTIVTKSFVTGLDEAHARSAGLIDRNDEYRNELIKTYDLINKEEKKLGSSQKIGLTLQRSTIEQARTILRLERQQIAATTELNVLKAMEDPRLNAWGKLQSVVAEVRVGVAKLNVDYQATLANVNGISAGTARWLAVQTAVSKAVLITKSAIQVVSASMTKLLGIVGGVMLAYTLAQQAYDAFFVSDADKEREKTLESITTLMEDQTKLIKEQEKAVKELSGSFEEYVSIINRSLRGISELGGSISELQAMTLKLQSMQSTDSKNPSVGMLGMGAGELMQSLGNTDSTPSIGIIERIFGSEEASIRKKSRTSLVAQISILDEELGKAVDSMFNKHDQIKDLDIFDQFIKNINASEKALTASSSTMQESLGKLSEFTKKQEKETFVTPILDSIGLAKSGMSELSAESARLSAQLAQETPGSDNYKTLTRQLALLDEQTQRYRQSVVEAFKEQNFEIDNFSQLQGLLKLFEDLNEQTRTYTKNLDIAKKGESTLPIRREAKSSISAANTAQSLYGTDSSNLEKELDARMQIQGINKQILINQQDLTNNYLKTLEAAKARTTSEGALEQINKRILEVENERARIEKELADARETEVSHLERTLRLTQQKTAEENKAIMAAQSFMTGTGNVFSSYQGSVFETVAALNSFKGATEEAKEARGALAKASEQGAESAQIDAAATLADAASKKQLLAGATAASSALQTISSFMSASSQMTSDAIGYQIEMEQKRDGQSEESQAKIKKLREKQIKEEAKARKQAIMMNTASGMMMAIATAGNIYAGVALAAMTAAMGAQQLKAVEQAEAGQIAVLNTSASSASSGINRISVGEAGSVNLATNASSGEANLYRAAGGSVSAGTSVVLGERGPEEVTFNEDVMVTPTSKEGDTNNNSTSVQMNVTIQALDGADAERVFRNNADTLVSSIENEIRSRGRGLNR